MKTGTALNTLLRTAICAIGAFIFFVCVATALPARAQDATAARLFQTALEFRQLGVLEPVKIRDLTLTSSGGTPFDYALPTVKTDEDLNAYWSYFFRSTDIHIARMRSGAATVGFYNPFADAWLTTDWRAANGAWHLTSSHLFLADALRGATNGTLDSTPTWLSGREDNALYRLQVSASEAVKTYSLSFQHNDVDVFQNVGAAFQKRVFLNRVTSLLANVAAFYDEPTYLTPTQAVFAALSREAPEDVEKAFEGPSVVEGLKAAGALPMTARSQLVAGAVLQTDQIALILANAIGQGRIFFAIGFDPQDPEKPLLKFASPFDMYEYFDDN